MNRFLDRWVSWIFYLLAYRKLPTSYAHWALQESKNNSEIRSFLTPMTAKSNSTILQHDTRENQLQGTLKKPWEFPIYQTQMAFLAVFVFIIRAVFPWASVRCWSFATSLSRWNISKLGYYRAAAAVVRHRGNTFFGTRSEYFAGQRYTLTNLQNAGNF